MIMIMIGITLYTLRWLRTFDAPQIVGELIRSVETDEKLIALTFDDGPNPPYTNEILDLLKQYKAKATFFVEGRKVELFPEITKRAYADGHEIANHSWSHPELVYKSPAFVRNQIESTDQIIRKLGYQRPIHFRAPYGSKFMVLPYVLYQMDKKHILWNLKFNDWQKPPVEKMFREFQTKITNGSIVLLHDGGGDRSNTVRLVKLILDQYGNQEYRFVTISELLSYTAHLLKSEINIYQKICDCNSYSQN